MHAYGPFDGRRRVGGEETAEFWNEFDNVEAGVRLFLDAREEKRRREENSWERKVMEFFGASTKRRPASPQDLAISYRELEDMGFGHLVEPIRDKHGGALAVSVRMGIVEAPKKGSSVSGSRRRGGSEAVERDDPTKVFPRGRSMREETAEEKKKTAEDLYRMYSNKAYLSYQKEMREENPLGKPLSPEEAEKKRRRENYFGLPDEVLEERKRRLDEFIWSSDFETASVDALLGERSSSSSSSQKQMGGKSFRGRPLLRPLRGESLAMAQVQKLYLSLTVLSSALAFGKASIELSALPTSGRRLSEEVLRSLRRSGLFSSPVLDTLSKTEGSFFDAISPEAFLNAAEKATRVEEAVSAGESIQLPKETIRFVDVLLSVLPSDFFSAFDSARPFLEFLALFLLIGALGSSVLAGQTAASLNRSPRLWAAKGAIGGPLVLAELRKLGALTDEDYSGATEPVFSFSSSRSLKDQSWRAMQKEKERPGLLGTVQTRFGTKRRR